MNTIALAYELVQQQMDTQLLPFVFIIY